MSDVEGTVEIIEAQDDEAPKSKLTELEQKFLDLLLTEAAMDPVKAMILLHGPSPMAAANAQKYLKTPRVIEAIRNATERRLISHGITRDAVIIELAGIARSNIDDFMVMEDGRRVFDLDSVGRTKLAAVASITVNEKRSGIGDNRLIYRNIKVKFHDKLEAIEKLCKIMHLYEDMTPAPFIQDNRTVNNNNTLIVGKDGQPQQPTAESAEETYHRMITQRIEPVISSE